MNDTMTDSLSGRLLDGRYSVTARIAHGGMATVYLATDTRLDRQVALKVMHAELARDADFVQRFIDEAKSVARLSHQNVVAVYDQGADGPYLYLAMEYVPGRTLKDLLREHGRFGSAAALDIISGVLAGLAAAHSAGIVHRDVKPENVLITQDGRIKVADFGLARAHAAAGHTKSGVIIGTVAYVPPEQVTGASASGPRGDVYSAGVLLFELLTGRQPHTGETPIAVAYQHVNQDIPAPSTMLTEVPAAVDDLVLAATSRDPGLRPADAGQFLRSVRNVREGTGPAERGGPGERGGGSGLIGVGVQGTSEAPWLGSGPGTGGWSGGNWNTSGWNAAGNGNAGSWPGGNGDSAGGWPVAGSNGPGTGWADGTGGGRHAADRGSEVDFASGAFGSDPYGLGGAGTDGSFGQSNHTLVVRREEPRDYRGGTRESLLGRWLFGPRLALVAVLAALAVLAGYGAWYVTGGRDVAIPVVTGDSVQTATSILEADGFQVLTGSARSNTVQQGMVATTDPLGRAPRGAKVVILVASGPFTSTIPVVKGDTKTAALSALGKLHLTVNTQLVGSNLPIGTVVGTVPKAGTIWPQTRPVTLQIAGGKPLPSFKGMSQSQAQAIAQRDGLQLSFTQDTNSTQAQGTIERQNPAPGTVMTPNESVTLTVAAGQQLVPLPDVITLNVRAAREILESAGFKVVVVGGSDFFSIVWEQDPSTPQAPQGSTVTLQVEDGVGFGGGGNGNGNGNG